MSSDSEPTRAAPHEARSPSPSPAQSMYSEAGHLVPGTVVGRYVIVRHLAAGGMGAVAVAYDTKLARKVAIKTLLSTADATQQELILREAQTLAKLSHPNVVAIYDVGVEQGQIFLAMEYLEGVTLREWLRSPRTTREILAVLKQAGNGLAAAHAAGLVHRDFKPSNVVVGDDGRVCILDFGIAHVDRNAKAASDAASVAEGMTFGMVGTTGYFAPEQLKGGDVDARADVFSFGVTAWRAIYGTPAFPTKNVEQYVLALEQGPTPPKERGAAWLHRVLLRCIEADRERRYPSMTAVLAALDADPTPRRRRLAVGFALAAAAALALGGWREQARHVTAACNASADEAPAAWRAHRESISALLRADPGPSAVARADKALARVDAYVESWRAAKRESCIATRRDKSQSEEVYAIRDDCFDRSRDGLAAELELADAEARVRARFLESVQELTPVSECAEAPARRSYTPLPADPSARDAAREARRLIARARALAASSAYVDAQRVAADASARAGSVKDQRTVVAADAIEATMALRRNEPDAASRVARALRGAEAAGDDRTGALLAGLVAMSLVYAQRPDDAERWIDVANGKTTRIGDDADVARQTLNAEASVAWARGDPERAVKSYEALVQTTRSLYGTGSHSDCSAVYNLALARADLGLLSQGIAEVGDALRCQEVADVERAPIMIDGYGYLLAAAGRIDESVAALREETNRLQARDPQAAMLRRLHTTLGLALARGGRAEAKALAETCVVESASSSTAWYVLGLTKLHGGDASGAVAACRRAVELDPDTSPQRRYGEDYLACLGDAELHTGNVVAAREHLEKSVALTRRNTKWALAAAKLLLARALAAPPRGAPKDVDLARALSLAREARDAVRSFATEYPPAHALLDDAEAWLSAAGRDAHTR